MPKLFRVSLVFLIALAIFSIAGCRLISPSDSDDDYVPVIKNLVIPVVLPSEYYVEADPLTKLTIRGDVNLAIPVAMRVVISNTASQSMGLPKYWAKHPTDNKLIIVFFAKTTTELGMTDTSAVGTFTMTLKDGAETDIPAGRFADILVTTARSLTTAQVVAGVARAMGVETTPTAQNQVPTIVATVPRVTVTAVVGGAPTITTEKIAIGDGTVSHTADLGTPNTPLSVPIVVATAMKAKPGMEATAKQELIKLVSATREEAGCLGYDVFQGNDGTFASQGVSTQSTGMFVLRETWRDKAAIDFHCATSYFGEFWAKADTLFETPAGDAGPFRVTFALDSALQENPGTIGYQRVALVSAKPAFDDQKSNFLSIIHTIRARTQNFIGYESFQGDGTTAGTATSSLIIWERFVKPADGSSLWTPVADFLDSSTYKVDLIALFGATLDMSKISGSYLDPIYCPPYANLKIDTGLKVSLIPLPTVWPGF
ncbi:MAG: antibiotic biosynthesis monooxygenase [Candidatus Riflebacteria bacterium]|nr:antibiotic biosynthesis monooxygenase [Candidatus Riflebacteria bacterium]